MGVVSDCEPYGGTGVSSSRPPERWPPSAPDGRFGDPDPDDDDTGPMQISTPSLSVDDAWDDGGETNSLPEGGLPGDARLYTPRDSTWPRQFEPLTINPRPARGGLQPIVSGRRRPVAGGCRWRTGLLAVAFVARCPQFAQHRLNDVHHGFGLRGSGCPGPAAATASCGLPLRFVQTRRCGGRCSGRSQLREELRSRRPAVGHLHVGQRQGGARRYLRHPGCPRESDCAGAEPEANQAGINSTSASATASSRAGAVTTARKPSPSFQMLALSVSPGNTTPANRAP